MSKTRSNSKFFRMWISFHNFSLDPFFNLTTLFFTQFYLCLLIIVFSLIISTFFNVFKIFWDFIENCEYCQINCCCFWFFSKNLILLQSLFFDLGF